MAEETSQDVSFTAFVLSLVQAAAVHLGDRPDPSTGQKGSDLPAARQMIDTLAMIEEKTRGNLTIQERQLIEQLLYELRMKYVEMTQHTAARTGGGGDREGSTSNREP